MTSSIKIAVMRGDGIGADVTNAALAVTDAALARCGLPPCATDNIDAGASYFAAAAVRPMEFGGDMGTIAVTRAVLDRINDRG